ncbi:MAG: D-tyrosyl-tRNA(Tyr) deacylase [Actinobacteria bacterium]|nr:D-tyrosyl-tRNA(Tyr) deacylase [Actinomycetota bacterium]
MRIVLQRVREASVTVGGTCVARIGTGLVALVGVARGDTDEDARRLARKAARLRLFPGDERDFERSLIDVRGALLCVSQFTLLGDTRRGTRPSWTSAAPGVDAAPVVAAFAAAVAAEGVVVESGRFGATMDVALVNDGPVTLVLSTDPPH